MLCTLYRYTKKKTPKLFIKIKKNLDELKNNDKAK